MFVSIAMALMPDQEPNIRVFVVIENQDTSKEGYYFNIEMDHTMPLEHLPDFDVNSSLLFQGGSYTIESGVEIACAKALTRAEGLEIIFSYEKQDQIIKVMLTSPKYFSSQATVPFKKFSQEMKKILGR